jgi:hypothetical protein
VLGRFVDAFWGVAVGGGEGVWCQRLIGVPAASSTRRVAGTGCGIGRRSPGTIRTACRWMRKRRSLRCAARPAGGRDHCQRRWAGLPRRSGVSSSARTCAAQQRSREHDRRLLDGGAQRLEPEQCEGATIKGSPVEEDPLRQDRPRRLPEPRPCAAVLVREPSIVRHAPRQVGWPLSETHTHNRHGVAILPVEDVALRSVFGCTSGREPPTRARTSLLGSAVRPFVVAHEDASPCGEVSTRRRPPTVTARA